MTCQESDLTPIDKPFSQKFTVTDPEATLEAAKHCLTNIMGKVADRYSEKIFSSISTLPLVLCPAVPHVNRFMPRMNVRFTLSYDRKSATLEFADFEVPIGEVPTVAYDNRAPKYEVPLYTAIAEGYIKDISECIKTREYGKYLPRTFADYLYEYLKNRENTPQ